MLTLFKCLNILSLIETQPIRWINSIDNHLVVTKKYGSYIVYKNILVINADKKYIEVTPIIILSNQRDKEYINLAPTKVPSTQNPLKPIESAKYDFYSIVAIDKLVNLNQIIDPVYKHQWEEIQKLDEERYLKYFNQAQAEGKEFMFLHIISEKVAQFQWKHQAINRDMNNQVSFTTKKTTNPYFGLTRPLMVDKETFIRLCLDCGITNSDISYFFSDKMN